MPNTPRSSATARGILCCLLCFLMSVATATERQRDAERKRDKRAQEKLVIIPQCENRQRRADLEADDTAWLMHYYGEGSGVPDPFWYTFTNQQQEMIEAFRHAILYNDDQSIAASRGEGKTTLLERMIKKYTLHGALDYSVLFQASGALAENSLDSIKVGLEDNTLLLADYPEVCVPVRALENTPNRAHYQLVSGHRHDNGEPYEMAQSHFSWCGQEIIFPNVPGSPSAAAIIATRGLDSAVRGLKRRGKRPKLAAIDDPDTADSARSEDQAAKLEDRIDKDIGGLGGQQRPIARIMLTTIQSRIAASYKFTDPAEKPSWKGKRFRYLVKEPERLDLWEEYIQIRQEELQAFAAGESEDKHCRLSHQFYIDNREAMDKGAEVANENRFNPEVLPDGSQVELSSLQHYYNEVARLGQKAVDTEYNNDPPEEDGPIESGITIQRIQRQLSGFEKGIVPGNCVALTMGVDVQKYRLFWVVKGWCPDATNYVIDYGQHQIHGLEVGSDEGIEFAIKRAILELAHEKKDCYCKVGGEVMQMGLPLVDSGYQATAVYQACLEYGMGIYPAKGHGKSNGCASLNFSESQKRTRDKKPGDGWFIQTNRVKGVGTVKVVHCDTDRWKSFEHERWLTAPGKPGAAYLYGEITDEERKNTRRPPKGAKQHFSTHFAHQVTAEVEAEDFVNGKLKRIWKPVRRDNHYLDACYLADVAASVLGIRLLGDGKVKLAPENRPSAKELAGRK